MKSLSLPIIASLLFSTSSIAATTSWSIDPAHSSVGFKVKHMMISDVRGSFRDLQGTVSIDESKMENSKVEVTIAAASIDTGIKKRDDHLRSADFFDVANYPNLTFTSKRVTDVTKEGFKLVGDLTIHGVTKEVTLAVTGPTAEAKDPWGNMRKAAKAITTINRKDFGLTWNAALETGGVLVGEDVQIELDVQFIKQAS
ncbi:Polyisoprenoid-binding protein YceI [Malonomonas rubra DSM 5091]|uniref:Polyisoprenoid-binding protein YceI n=1 Tax=Malonomonas rubra DSM 5091 TaxID=1122189 RepID=A0A1M6CD90_MALRU|nr:YceI family protein [Malonomonas rubra]SHI58853.1 Polyisoprenoid-binding protein YceI [Malonomonas rubra DSM 5091]